LRLGLHNGLFPYGLYHQYPAYIPLLPVRATCLTPLILIYVIVLFIFGEAYKLTKLLVMRSSAASRYTIPRRCKYSPQHPVLKHSVNFLLLMSEIEFHTHTEPQAKL
jgi:hypothetical protein